MFTRIGCEGRPPHFHVEFYTYSSLVITLRRRGDMFYVRFSDLLQRAPQAVLEGAAALLLARVFRRRPSRALRGRWWSRTWSMRGRTGLAIG